ncbi:MAG: ion transporter [Candidatus Pacebacteria bacterium]|nr:ion transporter [Candidatus Paceibacterota bacterium]
MQRQILTLVIHPAFERLVLMVIVINAITLGLETYPGVMAIYGSTLLRLDLFFVIFFVIELLLKLLVYRGQFWKDGWNWFDASVVLLTILPFLGIAGLGNVSAFRAVRLLRVLSIIPSFKRVLRGIGRALAGSVAVMAVLGVILYVYAVISVKLFRDASPERFADLDSAFFTYFQIMTLDAWSDIVRPIMDVHWWAGLFFMSFIVTAVFILLSIIIGVASNAISHVDDDTK